jgi:hypothetical protein
MTDFLFKIGWFLAIAALAVVLHFSYEATEFFVCLTALIVVLWITGRAALLDARRRHRRAQNCGSICQAGKPDLRERRTM